MALRLIRNMTSAIHMPFWGPPTASVDWCEVNYEVTPYIAEYFNTVSSFAMSIVGMMGLVLHPWAEARFKVAFLSTVAVGLGSVAFHGTLWKVSQALDEVPMLYSALTFVYIGICQRFTLATWQRRLLSTVLFAHAIITSFLVTMTEGHWQFTFFHISFGTAQIFATFQAVSLYRARKARLAANQRKTRSRVNRTGMADASSMSAEEGGVWIFERGIAIYLFSFVCWLVDMLLCEYLNPHYQNAILPINPQMHAWWHILVSVGLYNMALFTLLERMDSLGAKPSLQFAYGLIPYVDAKRKSTTLVKKKSE